MKTDGKVWKFIFSIRFMKIFLWLVMMKGLQIKLWGIMVLILKNTQRSWAKPSVTKWSESWQNFVQHRVKNQNMNFWKFLFITGLSCDFTIQSQNSTEIPETSQTSLSCFMCVGAYSWGLFISKYDFIIFLLWLL